MKLSLHKLLFLFSFCLFICPKNVFAAEQLVMNSVSAATYTLNSETYVTNQLHEVGMGQNKFKTFHSGNISYFVYKYELDKDIPRSDVSLRLMIGTYTTTTFIEPPLVSLNGTTCNTYVTGDSGLTSERQLESGQTFTEGTYVGESARVHVYSDYEYYHDFEYWYRSVYSGNTTVNVLCKDIDSTRNVTIYVWVPNHSSVDYGISSNWYYSVVNGVESKLDETNKRLDEQKKATEEQTKTLKDSDTTESTGKAGSFFSDFKSEDYGLSDIITLPLENHLMALRVIL